MQHQFDERKARKAISKKLNTGKVRRALNRAVDPEAGARRDAGAAEAMRIRVLSVAGSWRVALNRGVRRSEHTRAPP